METKYTPGPLGIKGSVTKDGAEDFAVVAGGQIIAEVFGRSSLKDFHPSRENANLFAAAPDLLEALEKLVGMVPEIARALPFGVPMAYAVAFDDARAALTKARGEVAR
jgi:hypothetical protein